MTSDELLPIAGLVAALGVALLLVERGAILRLAGIAAAVAGSVPLINAQAPGLSDAVDRSPLLVVAAGVGGVGAFVLGTAVALRWPWLVPIAGLVIALRFPLSNPVRPAHFLLPLYGVLACGLAALAWSTLRRRGDAARPRPGGHRAGRVPGVRGGQPVVDVRPRPRRLRARRDLHPARRAGVADGAGGAHAAVPAHAPGRPGRARVRARRGRDLGVVHEDDDRREPEDRDLERLLRPVPRQLAAGRPEPVRPDRGVRAADDHRPVRVRTGSPASPSGRHCWRR